MRPFVPPQKFKKLYWLINSLLILLFVLFRILLFERPEYYAIPFAAFCLFNGLWSINKNWYSAFHRKDRASSANGFWIILLVLGSAMTVLLLIVHILRFLGYS